MKNVYRNICMSTDWVSSINKTAFTVKYENIKMLREIITFIDEFDVVLYTWKHCY